MNKEIKIGEYWWVDIAPMGFQLVEVKKQFSPHTYGVDVLTVRSPEEEEDAVVVHTDELVWPLWMQPGETLCVMNEYRKVSHVNYAGLQGYRVFFERNSKEEFLGIDAPYNTLKQLNKLVKI
jgi:hypothetical protein